VLSACGTSSTAGGGHKVNTGGTPTSTVTCPDSSSWHLVTSGTLTDATDTTYAPAEYADPNNPANYIGYDMDLIREIGRRLCLKTVIVKDSFGSLITGVTTGALGQQKYDVSISSFTITSSRQQTVDMIPYFQAGESVLVPKGNPGNIKTFTDMCGKTISVQNNTTEQADVDAANGVNNSAEDTVDNPFWQACSKLNKPIKELHFDDETVVIQQVLNSAADAAYQDQPVTAYYVKLNSSKVDNGAITVAPSPEGIVVRKDNKPLEDAINAAITGMRTDGTYLKILQAWGVQDLAYPPLNG
jgi:polar amino acid transport system substrate-binding protein